MNEDRKLILKTSLITLGVIVFLAIILFCVNIFCFPAKVADFLQDLGMRTFASDLYYKEYEKNRDIEYLAKSLNLKIEVGHNAGIVSLSEEFFANESYAEYISNLNKNNLNTNFNLYTKSKLINEDNYYKNAYIKALIEENKVGTAFNYSKSLFSEISPTFKDLKVYAFSNFIDKIEYEKFNEKIVEQDEAVLYQKINMYFEDIYGIFSAMNSLYGEEDAVYIYALSSRILQVGNDLKQISDNLSTTINKTEIEAKLTVVADFMQGLLEE